MKVLLKLLAILCFILFLTFLRNVLDESKGSYDEKYFKTFNVELTGVISRKELLNSNIGMLQLTNVKSNYKLFDQRGTMEYYYCVIRNSKAVVIENSFNAIEIGDSVSIKGQEDKVQIFRNNELVLDDSLYVNSSIFVKPDNQLVDKWLE